MAALNAMNLEVLSSNDVSLITGGCGEHHKPVVQKFHSKTHMEYEGGRIEDETWTTRTIFPHHHCGKE